MKNLFFLLLVISGLQVFSQQASFSGDSEPRLVFNQGDFGERFAVLADYDREYNYFVTDLTKMPSRFQRVYFLNLVFADQQVISLDSDLSKDQLWFKVPSALTEQEAVCKFDDLRAEAMKAENGMTENERQQWLAGHDKFPKSNH